MNTETIKSQLEESLEKIEKVHKERAKWEGIVARQEVVVEILKGKAFRKLSSGDKKLSDVTKKHLIYDEEIIIDVENSTTLEIEMNKLANFKAGLAEAISNQMMVKEVVENLRELLRFEISVNYSTR